MSRDRIIYQNKALFAGPTGVATLPVQLNRIQSINFDYDLASLRTEVVEMGRLAPISRPLSNPNLTVNLSFDYLLTDGKNEANMGLTVATPSSPDLTSCISGIMAGVNDTRNYYVLTVEEGGDAARDTAYTAGQAANHYVAGIGNGFLTSYGLTAEVGGPPSVSCSVEGANLVFYTGSSGISNPAIDYDTAARLPGTTSIPTASTGSSRIDVLLPGDVEVTWGADLQFGGADITTMHPQSVSVSVPLSRTVIQRLGSKVPYSREIELPITATLSVSAILSEIDEGALNTLLTGCANEAGRDVTIRINNRCDASDAAVIYKVRNALLDSQSFGINLQGQETVDMQFSTMIAGPQDTVNGVVISGSYT